MYLFVHTRWDHLYLINLTHIIIPSSCLYSNIYQSGLDPFFFIWGVVGSPIGSTGWEFFSLRQVFFYLVENFLEDQRTWLSSCDRLPL